jgi:hypothetical protein
MRLTEHLSHLLKDNEEQAKNPAVWQDNAWKSHYYLHLNAVHNTLEATDNLISHAEYLTSKGD